MTARIYWTKTDEAPALATYALLPIVKSFTAGTALSIEVSDISLAGRILALFPERLRSDQKVDDALSKLSEVAKTPDGNILKLPNISASLPQLQAAIEELQQKGYDIPSYPEEGQSDAEIALRKLYARALGSAVNPVLREGNSDRRPAASVKKFAQKFPHRMMKPWPESGSKARVATMKAGDFYGTECSMTVPEACNAKIEFVAADGTVSALKEKLPLLKGEVIDAAVMRASALREFYSEQIELANKQGELFSLHLKATMMKVSDPVMFGHCVSIFFKDLFAKYGETLAEIGFNPNNGMADLTDRLTRLPEEKSAAIKAELEAIYEKQPSLAMVDSRHGITNLHAPNLVIIDASMPNIVRDGGKMWDKNDQLCDCVAVIPDRSYATMYAEIVEDAKAKGQFDPATMGNVANVGLMAQKAEEYGSHDKTFVATDDGEIRIVNADSRETLLSQKVSKGDIFRACQTKDIPIRDWVKLAVTRARASGSPAIFWLDPKRGHDAEIIKKINAALPELDTKGLDIQIMTPVEAMRFTLARVRRGEDTISVTGNVLRDFLTDLFPILELGTSARMLSIVPLLAGGGLFETGAGGSAPKHVQQLLEEGHLRWDSLGEYCALVPTLEKAAEASEDPAIAVLAKTLDTGISSYLENGRAPSRKVGELDNRGSSFYIALYWAQALAAQSENAALKSRFSPVAEALASQESSIVAELNAAQGKATSVGGYYLPDDKVAYEVMRPSATLNKIVDGLL